MNAPSPAPTQPAPPRWTRSRYGFVLFWFGSLFGTWLVLRLVLLLAFRPAAISAHDLTMALLVGTYRDIFAGLLLSLPVLLWLVFARDTKRRVRWRGWLFWGGCWLIWSAQAFVLFAEYFFFEEFKSRFNTVAVDYLLFPYEVFVNIWESYHVAVVVAVCAAFGLAWVLPARALFRHMWERPFAQRTRLGFFAGGALAAALLAPGVHLRELHVCTDRTMNEIANNGVISFVAAAWTHNLDYGAFYKTMPLAAAYERTRQLVAAGDCAFTDNGQTICRQVAGDPNRPRLNVVIFLEESLGSEFWGSLGRTNTLTPEMDKLAATEGMLFTNIYASGNRTVRGMEGVLSSFPPLPGDSIVKRNLSDNVETIARLLKRDGYATLFTYGGRGVFDDMRSFALRNGYDRFVEEKDFDHITFSTIWGVCDEDLYDRSLHEMRALAQTGRPFFTTILSVSNHKPYTFPKGRIPEDPDKHKQEYAVKYADYALGRFFRQVKAESFWTNTIFVVVADHGARVYGSQNIPIGSYEIPLLITGPAAVKTPSRPGQLGCSLDVSPTVLGLIGRPYQTLFFGRDLLKGPPAEGRALMNHNRDIGLLGRDRLVVLGLMKTDQFYAGDPKAVNMMPLANPAAADFSLEQDAIALFEVADDLYMHQRYHLDPR